MGGGCGQLVDGGVWWQRCLVAEEFRVGSRAVDRVVHWLVVVVRGLVVGNGNSGERGAEVVCCVLGCVCVGGGDLVDLTR